MDASYIAELMGKNATKERGFTLIELSIVLVVIGLIVGGVLVGQHLISAAQVRKQITQVTDLETQINTFRTKYDCLPGDCPNATAFLGTSDGAGHPLVNGDGDFIIRSSSLGAYAAPECLQGYGSDEPSQLFLQLNAAKLGNYSFTLTSSAGLYEPETALSSGTTMYVSCLTSVVHPNIAPAMFGSQNVIVIGGETGQTTRVGYSMGLYSWYYNGGSQGIQQIFAQSIDSKIDDGSPNSGNFGIISSYPNNPASCTTGSNSYPTTSNNCLVVVGKVIKSF